MKRCLVCADAECEALIDFGPQPVCHHFSDAENRERAYPMALGQCVRCGLVQATPPVPPEALVPYFDWISYNEPEAHLDQMTDMLTALPGITKESVIGGVSYKEDSTLRRLRERGFGRTWRLDPENDLGITNRRAGIESIQQKLVSETTRRLVGKHERADILIVRHMLEHSHATPEFLRALRELIKPDGYLVFEVPDCARAFDLLDYTTLWEDHTLYFVEATLLRSLHAHGLKTHRFERYRAPYENCLVAVVQPAKGGALQTAPSDLRTVEAEHAQGKRFAASFERRTTEWRQVLTEQRARGKVALLGAGHLAAVFINLHGLTDLIDCVIDDNPNKRGRRMPGSALPIVGSEVLYGGGVALCLTSLGAESERKVVEKHAAFVASGGVLASIFPVKPDQILNVVAGSPRVG